MLDRAIFLRPFAHRGLHAAGRGIIENSGPAFEAAIDRGFGIECDLRPAADGTPMVFHDVALARLIEAPGTVLDHPADDLARLTYRGDPNARVLRLADLLALVAGQVPILVEIKSEWDRPEPGFIAAIAEALTRYKGAFAIMSFDPAVVAALRPLLPNAPRGIVSGLYDEAWWPGKLDTDRAYRLSHLIDSRPADPHFFAYHVAALPTPVTRCLREGLGIPILAWTVRTREDLATSREWADAPIFEDIDPSAQSNPRGTDFSG
jgi:glycerophosphoryl diester phosphodiesterase